MVVMVGHVLTWSTVWEHTCDYEGGNKNIGKQEEDDASLVSRSSPDLREALSKQRPEGSTGDEVLLRVAMARLF